MLHITNGDGAGNGIAQSGISGTVLPWRDVLHEGPVPAGLSLRELRETRARFLADRGWATYDRALADFARRDAILAAFRDHDEVVLWFEHDLYDQLQLVQILDWFADQDLGRTTLSLVAVDRYPGVVPFYGLGQLTPEQLATLFPTRRPVTRAQLDLARAAWDAFRSPDPTAVERLLEGDTAALPFLSDALTRSLEEFPAVGNGLSRTERLALEGVLAGHTTPGALFRAVIAREERPYLGELANGHHPLLAATGGGALAVPGSADDPIPFARRPIEVTTHGRAVAAGRADRIALNGIDRWLGGVHLRGRWVPWRRTDDGGHVRLVSVA
jgi:Domain of unknown function (DUF1835)